jgi:hypothetical protein
MNQTTASWGPTQAQVLEYAWGEYRVWAATARQLEFLKHQWVVMSAPEQDPEKRHRFLLDCEEAISSKNNAWMAKWVESPGLMGYAHSELRREKRRNKC